MTSRGGKGPVEVAKATDTLFDAQEDKEQLRQMITNGATPFMSLSCSAAVFGWSVGFRRFVGRGL